MIHQYISVNTPKFLKNVDLAIAKFEKHKVDAGKIETVPADLSKFCNAIQIMPLSKRPYIVNG